MTGSAHFWLTSALYYFPALEEGCFGSNKPNKFFN